MTEERPEKVIRRILVALDASAHSLAALEEAATLAAGMEAELAGLFVEDARLLRIAALPFAREIRYPSGADEPLNRVRMERELRARGEQLRKALEAAAGRAQTPCSFRVVRGEVTAEILAAAGEADLVLMGRTGWSPAGEMDLGSTALAVAAAAPGALLLVQRGGPIADPIVAVCDGGESAESLPVLETAIRIASALGFSLTVLMGAPTPGSGEDLEIAARRIAGGRPARLRFRRMGSVDLRACLRAVAPEGCGLLVLAGSSPLAQHGDIQMLLRERKIPILLVR